jgi:hypothetical protein
MEEFFAQSSLAKFIIQDIIMFTSRAYVKEMLGPSLKKVMTLKKNLSPDPRTNSMSEETKTKLGEIIRDSITDFVQSAEMMPVELKRIILFAQKKLDRKWPPTEASPLSNIIGFLFSHLIIPATAQPQLWGISKDAHTSDSGRTSIVLNKVYRMIAAGSQFDSASPLSAFNVPAKKYQSKLKDFVELVLNSVTAEDRTVPLRPIESPSSESSNAAFQVLHHCLYIWKDAILEYRNSLSNVPVAEARIFFDMMGILEELELIDGKPECIPDFTTLGMDKTTKPPSKATMRRSTPGNVASSSSTSSDQRPYVRQLSEKWNREHHQMVTEAKKRQDAADARKRVIMDEKEAKEARKASVSVSGIAPGSPSSPSITGRASSTSVSGKQSPIKSKPSGSSAAAANSTASSTDSDLSRAKIGRSMTTDVKGSAGKTSSNSEGSSGETSDASASTDTSIPTSIGSNPKLVNPNATSPTSPRKKFPEESASAVIPSESSSSSITVMDATQTHSNGMSGEEALLSPKIVIKEPSSPISGEDRSTSASNLETSESGSDIIGGSTASPKLSRAESELGDSEGGAVNDRASNRLSSQKSRGSRKPRKTSSSSNLAAVMSDSEVSRMSGEASASESVASPGKGSRRKKTDSRSPSTIEPVKTKGSKKPKPVAKSASDDEAIASTTTITASTASPTLRLHKEVMPLDTSKAAAEAAAGSTSPASGGADQSSPKAITILSLNPNPALNQLESTPVTPRSAEFLRERSNSLSGSTAPMAMPKKEKAMGLLGLGSPDSRSSTSMAQVVRELGVANAKLQKELELAQLQREQLERDIVHQREYHEAKANKMGEFHSKLTSSILYRRNKAAHLRRLTLHCKRTFNPSIDDNMWDFQASTPQDRRAVLASTIFARAKSTKSNGAEAKKHNLSRKTTYGSMAESKDLSDSSDDDSESPRSSSMATSLERSAGLGP